MFFRIRQSVFHYLIQNIGGTSDIYQNTQRYLISCLPFTSTVTFLKLKLLQVHTNVHLHNYGPVSSTYEVLILDTVCKLLTLM